MTGISSEPSPRSESIPLALRDTIYSSHASLHRFRQISVRAGQRQQKHATLWRSQMRSDSIGAARISTDTKIAYACGISPFQRLAHRSHAAVYLFGPLKSHSGLHRRWTADLPSDFGPSCYMDDGVFGSSAGHQHPFVTLGLVSMIK